MAETIPDLFAGTPANASLEYVRLRDPPNEMCQRGREHCRDLWRDFAELADEHFASEFPVRFHDRWFEMYFTVALLRAGLPIECPKPGPDVLLKMDGERIWIDATCATAGEEGLRDTVPQRPPAGAVWSPPHNLLALRVSNALSAKAAKFREYVERRIVPAGDVMAVAINVYAVPYAYENMQDIMLRSLYGVGMPTVTVSRDTGEVVSRDREQVVAIPKASGKLVDVATLLNGSVPHISAVLGSRCNAVNLPQRLGDDFISHPSPAATKKWTTGTIKLGAEWMIVAEEPNGAGWSIRLQTYRRGEADE